MSGSKGAWGNRRGRRQELSVDKSRQASTRESSRDSSYDQDDDIERIKTIGNGSFGSAFLVKKKDGRELVMKEINWLSSRELFLIRKEADLLKSLNHPNIVRIDSIDLQPNRKCKRCLNLCNEQQQDEARVHSSDVSQPPCHPCHAPNRARIFMEYCKDGDLSNFYVANKLTTITPGTIHTIFFQLAAALGYCHHGLKVEESEGLRSFIPAERWRAVLHRDIKPSNVLLADRNAEHVKLCDFGLGKWMKNAGTTITGTPKFMAPEVKNSEPWSPKADIYSLGCTMENLSQGQHFAELDDIVKKCMSQEPQGRPSSLVLVEMLGEIGHRLYLANNFCNLTNWENCMFDTILHVGKQQSLDQDHEQEVRERLGLLLKDGGNQVVKDGKPPLIVAIETGEIKLAQRLVNSGVNIMATDEEKITPLHMAAGSGYKDVVELLLKSRAVVTASSVDGLKPLHAAASQGHDSIVQLLLDSGADVMDTDLEGWTPLHSAAQEGHDTTVELLLESGAAIGACDKFDITPLHAASREGHETTAELLLNSGADIMATDLDKQTPLHVAACEGYDRVVELLLKSGADANHTDKYGYTALYLAACNQHTEVVKLLASAPDTPATQLLAAAQSGSYEVIRSLMEEGSADLEATDEYGYTALHLAALDGHETTVKLLLDSGVDVNVAEDENAETPLWAAASNGHDATVRLLLDAGAGMIATNDGWTALHVAASNGHDATVRLLLDSGADINATNGNGDTPLHISAEGGYETTVQLLLDSGAEIKVSNQDGSTALDLAEEGRHENVVQLLKSAPLRRQAIAEMARPKELYPPPKSDKPANDSLARPKVVCEDEPYVSPAPLPSVPRYLDWILLHDPALDRESVNRQTEKPDESDERSQKIRAAAKGGRWRVIRSLLEEGESNIMATDNDGYTALHIAAAHGSLRSVKLLLDAGAIQTPDKNGELPIKLARAQRHHEVAQLLSERFDKTRDQPIQSVRDEVHDQIVEYIESPEEGRQEPPMLTINAIIPTPPLNQLQRAPPTPTPERRVRSQNKSTARVLGDEKKKSMARFQASGAGYLRRQNQTRQNQTRRR